MKKIISIVFFSGIWLLTFAQPEDESWTHKSAGLDKLKSENYAEAIVEFTKSIELCSPDKKYDMIETYHCRAHCKSMLED